MFSSLILIKLKEMLNFLINKISFTSGSLSGSLDENFDFLGPLRMKSFHFTVGYFEEAFEVSLGGQYPFTREKSIGIKNILNFKLKKITETIK